MELCRNQAASADGEWLAFGPDTGNASRWHLLRHLPTYAGGPLTFDEIAKSSTGARKYLGYLRIDGDGAGKHFRDLRGNPKRIWGLSRLLNVFFTETANELISKKFPYIYPVYGGGDDLFVVGPWNDLLDFSLELRLQLHALTRDLTFSAGLSLAKAREHILTHANLAGQELESAKRGPAYSRSLGRDQIRALGATIDWETFARLLPLAKDVSGWIESKQMPNSFLQQVLRLHHYWHESYTKPKSRSTTPVERYKPLLYYQIQRNLKPGKPREWAEGLLKPDSLWPWANFIARYAMLAAKRGEAED
jgi:CRISPR-associated protein Csm1